MKRYFRLLPINPWFFAVAVSIFIANIFGPWWIFALVSFIVALAMRKGSGYGVVPVDRLALRVGFSASSAWIAMALFRDAPSGFRISYRLGAIAGLSHSVFLYIVLGTLIFIISSLAAEAGNSLATRLGSKALPADTEED
jgi:hypothetical protein